MLSEYGQEFYRTLFDVYGFEAIINDGMIASRVMGVKLPPEACFNAEVVTLRGKESTISTPAVSPLCSRIEKINQQIEIQKNSQKRSKNRGFNKKN